MIISTNGHSSQRNIINRLSLHSLHPDLGEEDAQQPTHHAAASRVYEHRHPFSEVGDFEEHHVGGDEVHGEGSGLREAPVQKARESQLLAAAEIWCYQFAFGRNIVKQWFKENISQLSC